MRCRGLGWAVALGMAVLLRTESPAAAAPVDCAKPIAPCTSCHNPTLTQPYAGCMAKPWAAPASAKAVANPLPASPKTLKEGAANFRIFCKECHGEKGDGAGAIAVKYGIPVANLTLPEVQRQSDGELFWKISHGYGAMPMWGETLSANDRWQLVDFVRQFTKPR
jgi:mono/diheme cytochrome c family protein